MSKSAKKAYTLNNFLEEEGISEEANTIAIKRVIAW